MKKKYKYNFSIVMSIYNVEKYLKKAIDSVINQNIGFEENVQLILINDGSIDNSEEICKEYVEQYPNNIIYEYKENGGLASAKNAGLKYVEGRYINFFDSDDIMQKNTLSEVYKFFSKNELLIDFVTIPLVFFESMKGLHPKYSFMPKKNSIIDLRVTPHNFILSGAASFYKKEVFDDFRFNETYLGEEDTLLNGTLYKKNLKFGYVCEKNVKYNYRKRYTSNSIVDISKLNPLSFETVVKLLDSLIGDKTELYTYEKELIIYELRSRYKTIDPEIFENIEEYNNIINSYDKYASLIDTNHILNVSKFTDSRSLRKLFCDKTNNSLLKYEDYLSKNSPITIENFFVNKNYAYIDVIFNNFMYENLVIKIFDANNVTYNPTQVETIEGPFDANAGKIKMTNAKLFKFKIDLTKCRVIKFILFNENTNEYFYLKKIDINPRCILSSYCKNVLIDNKYILTFNGKKIKLSIVEPKRKWEYFKYLFSTCKQINNDYHIGLITYLRLFNKRKKKYILINDRINAAGDNGEALFKYIYKERPDLAEYTYFVIDKKSQDYKRLSKIGKVVSNKTIKHKYLFLNSKIIYSSHTMPEYFFAFFAKERLTMIDLFNNKFVWLQHGITKDDISKAANRYLKAIDYIVSATHKETEEFLQNKYCFEPKQVISTGFSRYDLLENNQKNIISILPTWRRGLGGKGISEESFSNTQYYIEYSSILNNKKLNKLLKTKNYCLQFILHPEMSKYINLFKKFENSNIKIIPQSEANYNKIFSESKLLITDYSSVFFDFAYLKKPEIFFQFDEKEFFENHYKKGYFDYRNDAFGDVVDNSNDLIAKINYYFKNNFKMEQKYMDRVNNTFIHFDNKNCERIINSTIK